MFWRLRDIEIRTSLVYALLGGAWILLSDRLLRSLVTDPDLLTRLQTYKGWAFVLGSALLIFALLRSDRLGRARAEIALRASEERHRAITERISDVLYLSDEGFRLSYASPSVERVLGYSPGELAGRDMLAALVDEAELPRMRAVQEDLAAGRLKRVEGMEVRLRRKDGTMIWVEVDSTPIVVNGRFAGLQSVARDIDERKRAQEELRVQRQELARVGRALAFAEMSTAIAHEVNQPLAAILSNAQAALRFLDRDPPDLAEVRQALREIEHADTHAGEVIRRLRGILSRREIARQRVDLNEMGRDVLRLVGADATQRGVMTIARLDPALPFVEGDPVALQQVLLNLVSNALDAAGDSLPTEREVTVSTRREGDGAVAVTVSDTGGGVTPDQLGRLFEPFFTTKPGGLGLGLPLSRSLVTAHGGEIWARPNRDGGMTFGFRLPLTPDGS